jgi:hypothetical protein
MNGTVQIPRTRSADDENLIQAGGNSNELYFPKAFDSLERRIGFKLESKAIRLGSRFVQPTRLKPVARWEKSNKEQLAFRGGRCRGMIRRCFSIDSWLVPSGRLFGGAANTPPGKASQDDFEAQCSFCLIERPFAG